MLDSLYCNIAGYEAQRQKLLKKAEPGTALADYLSVPLPLPNTSLADLSLVAVDFETTGLDAKDDKLLSVGFVSFQGKQIKLADCYHQIVRTKESLDAANVTIHQITDDDKDAGHPYRQVVEDLLRAIAGKVMLAHYCKIERTFLQLACKKLWGITPPLLFVDTLVISKREFDKHNKPYHPSQFKLSNLRNYYGLPTHHAHNALNDAVATAELFLAQIAAKSGSAQLKLRDLIV